MNYAVKYIIICSLFVTTIWSLQAADVIDNNRGVIPFEMVDGLIVLEMEVSGVKGNYILDSGAESIIINRPAQRNDAVFVTIHGEREGERGEEQIKLGNYSQPSVEVWYVDLDDVTDRLSTPIDGLVGASILKDQDIMIDYDLKRIVLLEHSDYRLAASGTRRIVTLPFDQHFENMPVVEAMIDGSILLMGFDTGANTPVLTPSFGRTPQVDLTIGDLTVKNTPYIISDLSNITDNEGRAIQGILSASALGANQIVISYSRQRIYLIMDQSLSAQ